MFSKEKVNLFLQTGMYSSNIIYSFVIQYTYINVCTGRAKFFYSNKEETFFLEKVAFSFKMTLVK